MSCELENNSFVIVWKVVNWRMRRRYLETPSPEFVIKRFLNTTWLLSFNLIIMGGQFLYCSIKRSEDSEGPEEVNIDFSICVCHDPHEQLKDKKKQTHTFKKGTSRSLNYFSVDDYQKWIPYEEQIYIICHMSMCPEKNIKNNVDLMLPGFSSFALECSKPIVEHVKEDLQTLQKKMCYFPNKSFAQTLIFTEKMSFMWSLKDVLARRQTKVIASVSNNIPNILIVLHKNKENAVEVKIQPQKPFTFTYFSICNVCILDLQENIIYSQESTYMFSAQTIQEHSFEIPFNNSNKQEEELTFDMDTNFCIRLDIGMSKGDTISWIESSPVADFTSLEVAAYNPPTDRLQKKMKDVYDDKRFSDVSLQLPGKKFEVHKAILCADSAVFRAMFENNMKESETNFVKIDDIDEHIMERMLMYIYGVYGDVLESLPYEEALKLYEASDKYQILALQKKCAMYLKSQVTPENALDILCLSDAHADKELKSHVNMFIVDRIKEILSFEEKWDEFSKSNMLLANEILKKVCLRLTGMQINRN